MYLHSPQAAELGRTEEAQQPPQLLPREISTHSGVPKARQGGQEKAGSEEALTFRQHQEEHFDLLAPGQQLHEVELERDLMHSETSPHVRI